MLRDNLNSLRAELAGRASHERKKLAASKGLHNEPPHSLSDHKGIGRSNTCPPSPPGVSHQSDHAVPASQHGKHTAPDHDPGTRRCAHNGLPCPSQCCHAQHIDDSEHALCPPCPRTGSVGSDRSQPCPGHASSAAHPTQHHVSETDLQSLLSLAFARSRKWLDMRSKRGQNAKAQGTGSSKRPFDPFGIPTKRHGSSPARRDAMHPPLQDVLRLVRRLYGVDVGVRGGDKSSKSGSTVMLDPESLTPRYSEASDSDDDSDDWEEDRQ
ncbi:hypothetical protein PYCCODRAFT_559867 [Trametes coccinea BRFM310]|uniref:Uncharacterized protein n=1 Tax=Trametes coccinea (strain BRFM310) TaxID=1353009 RepID=A0A1Y2IL95_TRAC3|nr:hypothetical protein PYCCODRAFT_559867 [Trametes coccinea BRFM310]